MKNRFIFVGIVEGTREYVPFRTDYDLSAYALPIVHAPTGKPFAACIGPFRTMRAARFMSAQKAGNPHCRCVADAERIAKEIGYR